MKMDELVEKYIKLRELKSRLKAEYEAKTKDVDALQDKIEAELLRRFNENGLDSVKTPSGTAYVSVRSSATIADWDTFRVFLDKQEHPFDFVERRVSKEAVTAYKAANSDLPPGVNWSETRVVNFRR